MTRDWPHRAELVQRIVALKLVVFDFDGVFTDNFVYVLQDGGEAVRCSRADGIGLRRLERVGIEPIILSTETNPVVSLRSAKLKVHCRQGCDDKAAVLKEILESRGLEPSQAAFVGNDVNDLGCLELVGLPIVVQDAHPDVLGAALHQTQRPGGHGAVREVCDLIASVHEQQMAVDGLASGKECVR